MISNIMAAADVKKTEAILTAIADYRPLTNGLTMTTTAHTIASTVLAAGIYYSYVIA